MGRGVAHLAHRGSLETLLLDCLMMGRPSTPLQGREGRRQWRSVCRPPQQLSTDTALLCVQWSLRNARNARNVDIKVVGEETLHLVTATHPSQSVSCW